MWKLCRFGYITALECGYEGVMCHLKRQTMNKIKLIILLGLVTPLTIFGQAATEIAKAGIKSTVSIVALDKIAQPLSYGSGFIIDNETIVTNVHVIEGSNSAYVLMNGQEKKYSVSGYVAIDKAKDLVILKVSGLYGTALTLGSESFPEIGEKIYAVGNPKGLNGTFSEGIISGIRDLTTNQVLQITAPISPGSSGGPVLNSSGQVVGIAFASFSEGQNLNFAIPVKYLSTLKSKIATVTPLTTVNALPKSTTTAIKSNIKEGVTVRNINFINGKYIEFSVKNNLGYTVSDIKILFLVYDKTGVVVDYVEKTCFETSRYSEDSGIKPYLAKSFDFSSGSVRVNASSGSYVKARVLDFKINEE